MEIWERQADEPHAAFCAFKCYLELRPRSVTKVAEKIQKSAPLVRRWSSKYDWRERARAWDNSILEQAREMVIAEQGKEYMRQWREAQELREAAFAAIMELLNAKRGSLHALTELFNTARQSQIDLIEKLAPADEPQEMRIIIEDAEPVDYAAPDDETAAAV